MAPRAAPRQAGTAVVRGGRDGGDDDLACLGAALVEAFDGCGHRVPGLFPGTLADGRQVEAAHGIDPDMAVNIEHEDAASSQTEGLALAAKNLHSAASAV